MRDPDGHRIELFTSHYLTLDVEDEPARWNISELGGGWGPRPPQSWRNEATPFAGVAVHSAHAPNREAFVR